MSLTVTAPLTGDPFGPGFRINVATDFVGPFNPSTSYWDIKLTDSDGVNIVCWRRQYAPIATLVETFIYNYDGAKFPSAAPMATTLHGDAAALRIILVSSSSVIEDETITVVMDRQQGQVQELLALIPTSSSPAPTLTEEEHNAVLQTNVGVIAMSGFDVGQLAGAAASAIASGPPLGWGSLSGAYTLTGDGELPDLHAAFQDRYGVYWVATVIPAGLGHLHGATEEYGQRLIQWRTTHVVGGTEMVTEIADFYWHGGLWRFEQKLPERVQYSILPGVTIQARWWQFP